MKASQNVVWRWHLQWRTRRKQGQQSHKMTNSGTEGQRLADLFFLMVKESTEPYSNGRCSTEEGVLPRYGLGQVTTTWMGKPVC
jgi:hypothetical protein